MNIYRGSEKKILKIMNQVTMVLLRFPVIGGLISGCLGGDVRVMVTLRRRGQDGDHR